MRFSSSVYPSWSPRIWHGMRSHHWIGLLLQNRFRIHPTRLGLAGTVSLLTIFNTKMRIVQEALYGHQIRKTPIEPHPVFIIGHWRSGTTYLHELLAVDPAFCTPTTYQCFAPNHFLVTESTIPYALKPLMPKRRPMDNVRLDWFAPQEDEFALCNLGIPSPYMRMAFPNHADPCLNYLDMLELDPAEIRRWSWTFQHFLKSILVANPRRLVLKSPTHTGRIWLLTQLFPNARFIHMVRDPRVLLPSTINLWRSLDEAQALQVPHNHDLIDYINSAFARMYRGFDYGASRLAPGQLCHVRYEDLVRDPMHVLQRIYQQLDLGDFQRVRPALEQVVADKKQYQTNRYQLTDQQRQIVRENWGEYMRRYGYEGDD